MTELKLKANKPTADIEQASNSKNKLEANVLGPRELNALRFKGTCANRHKTQTKKTHLNRSPKQAANTDNTLKQRLA